MTKRKIYFRADAGADIGYGHFIRTLALADMLKDDFDCTFFTQSPTEYQRKEVSKVCNLYELPTSDDKFPLFINQLSGDEIVVLDNYFYTTEYQKSIKDKGCKLVCIDDMHDKHYVADVVINHVVTDESLFSTEPNTQLCLGLDWALLRQPFLSVARNDFQRKNTWFIAFGGSDVYNLTRKFVEAIHNKEYVKRVVVVVGDAYAYCSSLNEYKKVEVLKNLSAKDMALHMQQCEYAILPSSGICIEALSCGCKIYAGYYVENQMEIYNEFNKQQYIYPIGDLRKTEEIPMADIHVPKTICFIDIPLRYNNLFNSL
jgi:UDP-2,4-diacetamido-2,4,6-trideoxy-beta-L-altropyranose hydrolase